MKGKGRDFGIEMKGNDGSLAAEAGSVRGSRGREALYIIVNHP